MKKVLSWLLISVLLLSIISLSGCGVKKKVGQAITEKAIEKATGDKVDIDGDKITVKAEDGEEITYGGGEWPDTDLGKKIPKFNKGKIITAATEKNFYGIFRRCKRQ